VSAFPHLPLFTRDFLADTMHLNAQETGAYLLLLMIAWQSPGCRLPNDDKKLAHWARVDSKTWGAIKGDVLSFWTLKKGHWHQKRLSKVHDYAGRVTEARRAAANKRWKSKRNANAYPNAADANDAGSMQMNSTCNANEYAGHMKPNQTKGRNLSVSPGTRKKDSPLRREGVRARERRDDGRMG
jgi:uncharacterized protein YdaU (DUF1376 family)